MTVRDLLVDGAGALEAAGVPSPRVDAEWLLAHVLGITRTELYADGDGLTPDRERLYRELVARRARREPLAYVLGEWGFRRLTLKVDTRVLIPRPETETVAERALALLAGVAEPRVLDIGVGSGAIALAIADEHPRAQVTATECAPGALEVARENVARTGLGDRVRLVDGTLFAGVEETFDLIVSNPPYVSPRDIETLQPEVVEWEPREALVAEGATETIAEGARSRLVPGGSLVLETADGMTGEVAALLRGLGYEDVTTTKDLTGRERVVDGRAPR
jgi:release factor glutamine methyltransferase